MPAGNPVFGAGFYKGFDAGFSKGAKAGSLGTLAAVGLVYGAKIGFVKIRERAAAKATEKLDPQDGTPDESPDQTT